MKPGWIEVEVEVEVADCVAVAVAESDVALREVEEVEKVEANEEDTVAGKEPLRLLFIIVRKN